MTTKWVIPTKLSVEGASKLPDEVIKVLAKISTDMVLKYINMFIKSSQTSTDSMVQEVGRRFEKCFKEVNAMKDFLSSEEAYELAKTIGAYNLNEIRVEVGIESLRKYESLILQLLEDERVVATTEALDGNNLDSAIEEISNIMDFFRNDPDKFVAICELLDMIEHNRGMFKNAPFKRSNPTVLRYVTENKDKYRLILYGLQFAISKIESRRDARSWRLL